MLDKETALNFIVSEVKSIMAATTRSREIAVVSVHDKGQWFADIDVLKATASSQLVVSRRCHCGKKTQRTLHDYTSIDTFDELLDPPETPGIARAHNNWAARLAAVCIVLQKLDTTGDS